MTDAKTYSIPPALLPELRALHAAAEGANQAAQAATQAAKALEQRFQDKLGTVHQLRGIKPEPTDMVNIDLTKGTIKVGGKDP